MLYSADRLFTENNLRRPYWYLLALLESLVVLYLLRKATSSIFILMLGTFTLLILYTCARDFSNQAPVIEALFRGIDFLYSWEFNFLTFGIPFCSIGFLAYQWQWKISRGITLTLFLLFTAMRIPEYALANPFGSLSLLYIPQAICFFFFALNLHISISDALAKSCRQLSAFIYFSHAILLYNIFNPLLIHAGFSYTYAPAFILPKTAFIICICIALFLLLKNRKNAFCKILING